MTFGIGSSDDGQSDPELFGEVACLKGFISPAQLYQALTEQKADQRAARPARKIGEILVAMGAMTPKQVDLVLVVLNRMKL
ncbi:MAG: hypothetical protein ACT4PU_00595 [Planctomycetota bacterium]